MGLFFIRNLEISRASFVHSGASRLLGVEVVLARLPRENFAVLGDFEAFRI